MIEQVTISGGLEPLTHEESGKHEQEALFTAVETTPGQLVMPEEER